MFPSTQYSDNTTVLKTTELEANYLAEHGKESSVLKDISNNIVLSQERNPNCRILFINDYFVEGHARNITFEEPKLTTSKTS